MSERRCAAWCEEPQGELKRCSKCRQVWYCSRQCQEKHWKFHIFDCRADRPISTVYYLYQAAFKNLVPGHAFVLEGFAGLTAEDSDLGLVAFEHEGTEHGTGGSAVGVADCW